MATFTATDGKDYELEKWHPLPFVVGRKHIVPTMDDPYLFLLLKDGRIAQWRAFGIPYTQATHWKVSHEGWFEI